MGATGLDVSAQRAWAFSVSMSIRSVGAIEQWQIEDKHDGTIFTHESGDFTTG